MEVLSSKTDYDVHNKLETLSLRGAFNQSVTALKLKYAVHEAHVLLISGLGYDCETYLLLRFVDLR